MTPNYSDGNWHAWQGGDCPVHHASVVEVRLRDCLQSWDGKIDGADVFAWYHGRGPSTDIIAFRVITPHAEPAPEAPPKPASSPAVKVGDYVKSPDVVTVNLMLEPASAPDVAFDWGNKEEVAKITKAAKEALKDMQKPAKRDLRTIDEPFYSLDKKTQERLRKADAKGFPLQTKGLTPDGSTGSEWVPISKSGWYREETVRLDPTFTPPEKRDVIWVSEGDIFDSKAEAIEFHPHREPRKFKECRK